MSEQQQQASTEERIIAIRKLAALDLVFHGSRVILAEFAGTIIVCGGIGIWSLLAYFRTPTRPFFALLLGLVLCWIALNYVPLLLYAIAIVRHKSAEQEVAYEIEHKERFGRKYTLQSVVLLLLPLVVPLLSLLQERQKHAHRDRE